MVFVCSTLSGGDGVNGGGIGMMVDVRVVCCSTGIGGDIGLGSTDYGGEAYACST